MEIAWIIKLTNECKHQQIMGNGCLFIYKQAIINIAWPDIYYMPILCCCSNKTLM